ncbi:MAG: hypothetical protein ACLR6J_07740 [Parabacteroides merdae]
MTDRHLPVTIEFGAMKAGKIVDLSKFAGRRSETLHCLHRVMTLARYRSTYTHAEIGYFNKTYTIILTDGYACVSKLPRTINNDEYANS